MSKNKKYSTGSPIDRQPILFSLTEIITNQRVQLISGILLILFSLYLLFSMIGFFFSGGIDQSLIDGNIRKIITNPHVIAANPTGKLGAYISDLLINRWFGLASFFLCYLLILCGLRLVGARVRHFKRRIFIGCLIILWVSLLLGYITESITNIFHSNSGYLFPGGGHGYFVSTWLNALVGRIGTALILVFTFIIILFFGFERTFYRCVDYIKAQIKKRQERTLAKLREQRNKIENPIADDDDNSNDKLSISPCTLEVTQDSNDKVEEDIMTQSIEITEENMQDDHSEAITDFDTHDVETTCNTLPLESQENKIIHKENIENEFNTVEKTMDGFQFTVDHTQIEETVDHNLQPQKDYDPTLDLENYQYPPLELLEEHSSGNPKVTQAELDDNKDKIVETLRNYKIEITKIKATIGPTVTLYEIVPAPGVKISKIKNLEDDIALSLSALGIRIIAPIPGAGTIGIEVPNQNPEVVSMRGIIASKKFQESKYALPVALGRTISNDTYTFDLTKMPHLLVAGATGQGKSVGLNAIITSLLYKKHPSQLKFVMVDPKKVELSIYSVIEKHFLAKLPNEEEAIITETSKVVNTLNSLCIEMDTRYDLLKNAQVRNIKEYNEKFIKRQLNPNNGHKYLPYIVVIVDEFADLIMTAGKEVETPIARIAQLARAVGIHMIIATQRPSTNIITGVIKANFPARIAFKVASMIDSRTILDAPGANQLIGRGDMLISVGSEMTRVQCAFVDTPEVDAITHFIAKQQSYPSAFALPEYTPENENSGGLMETDLSSRDPLFEDAARLIVSMQQGSTSSIQRRFSIGYNRAGRIMDQLEAAGIVGPFEGSKPRQVLIPDEYTLEQKLK